MTTVKSASSLTCTHAGRSAGYGLLGITMADHLPELETFVRSKLKEYQYREVKGPFMMDRAVGKNGHWDNLQRCDVHHLV